MPDAAATVRARLFAMQDKQYQTFQQKLLPTLPPGAVIGVRTPALRRLAKELAGGAEAEAFLAAAPHLYYEENNLHAFLLERLKNSEVPCFLLVNKIDLLPREQVMQRLLEWQQRFDFDEIIPLSALKQDNVDELLRVIDGYLQEGIKYFPDDMVSDHGESFRIAEIIREKILFRTEEEVPHSIAVVIENREEDETQVFLQAMVIVERPSQKSILIGKQGSMIRSIRIAAQRELRQMLGKRVELELYVRVEENWRNRESKLRQFGYDEHE